MTGKKISRLRLGYQEHFVRLRPTDPSSYCPHPGIPELSHIHLIGRLAHGIQQIIVEPSELKIGLRPTLLTPPIAILLGTQELKSY
jgi:hypothetical protein